MKPSLRNLKNRLSSTFDSAETCRSYLAFLGLYAIAYWGDPIYFSYLSVYFREIGYSTTTIGILFSIGPAVALVAQPLWGRWGDVSPIRNRILYIILIGSGVSMLLMGASTALLYIAPVFIIHVFFRTSQHPVEDSMSLVFLNSHRLNFGPIRATASLGYMASALISGWLMNWNLRAIFPLYFIYMALTLMFARQTPTIKNVPRAARSRFHFNSIKKPWLLTGYVAYAFLLAAAFGFYTTFFPIYLTQDLGGSQSLLGFILFSSTAAEVLMIFKGERLMQFFGINKLLLFAGVISLIRWVMTYFVLSPADQVWVQLLHGISYMLTNFCLIRLIHDSVPVANQTSGQTLFGLVTNGVARIIPSFLGGYISAALGLRSLFLINIWITIAALILLIVIIWKSKERQKPDALHCF
ncbi:MAG: MFS transporter [Saccharofermentanales bacterium]